MNTVFRLTLLNLLVAMITLCIAPYATAQTDNSGYLTIQYRGGQFTIKRTDVLGNQTTETVIPTGEQESEDGESASTTVSNSSSGELNVPNAVTVNGLTAGLPAAPIAGGGSALSSSISSISGPGNIYTLSGLTGSVAYKDVAPAAKKSSSNAITDDYSFSFVYQASINIAGQALSSGTFTAGDALPVSGPVPLADGSIVTFNGQVVFCETKPILDSTTGVVTGTRVTLLHVTGTTSDGNGGTNSYDDAINQMDIMGLTPQQVTNSCQLNNIPGL
jgi:hypothetical protein